MKKNYIFKSLLLMIPVLAFLLISSSGGRTEARSGSPGDGGVTCASCHSGGNFGLTPSITTNIPASGYALNTDYTITVNSSSSSSKLGFQLVAENTSNAKIGTLVAGTGTRVGSNRITQSTPSSSGNWSFTWKSPSTNQGVVTFYAAVNATNGNGNTGGDQVVTTNTSANVLGISESIKLDFEMYPNPASDNITIQLPTSSEKATVQFYDYVGRLALTKTISSNDKIDVNSLNSGVYIVKVLSNDKIGSHKFIKN